MSTERPESFGSFEIDPVAAELRKDGRRVPLEPLPVKILLHLVRARGRLVTRRELRELGWPRLPGAAQNSLNTCIHQIRTAMKSAGDSDVEMETLRGRGYRLLVVGEGPDDAGGRVSRIRPALRAGLWATPVLVAVLVAAGLALDGRGTPAGLSQAMDRAHYLAWETGDLSAAKAVLDSARAAFPDFALTHGEWAEMSLRTGDLEGARQAAQRALALDQKTGIAYRVLGLVAMAEGDWNSAEALLRRVPPLSPDDPRSYTGLAFLTLVRGEFVRAEGFIRQALEADPLSAIVNQDAGSMYLLMGEFQKASLYCEDALRFKPRSAWAIECVFDAKVLLQQDDEAARWGLRFADLYGAAPPEDGLSAAEVVSWVQNFRLDQWVDAVERGAYPFGLALALAINDRPEEALEVLTTALQTPRLSVLTVSVDPRMQSLRQEPGFRQVRRSLGLPG